MVVPSFHDVPISCVNQAAINYEVPAELILAIIFVEGGRNGIAMANTNGTFDYGVMQINSSWLTRFTQFSTSAYQLQFDACQNVMVGSWILKQNIENNPDLFKAIGDYHSHTPDLNSAYAKQVLFVYGKIRAILAPGITPTCDHQGKIC